MLKKKSFSDWGIIVGISVMSVCLIIEIILDIVS